MRDCELVMLCQKGQNTPFSTLVERHQSSVFGVALQILKSKEEAEDVAQEAFVRVYQKIRDGGTIDFLPYARKVAGNLALDRLRRQGTALRYLEHQANFPPGSYAETPEEAAMRNHDQLVLRRLIGELPQMYRDVIVMHYAGGFSYEEIADKLGQPLSLVKNRLFRGKKLLKESYITEGVESV